MKSITSNWFECIVTYDKTTDDGSVKRVSEVYTVDALTFTEAESVISDEIASYATGDYNIKNINPAPYKEVFISDKLKDDRWFKVKIAFITFDERTGREKSTNVLYLVHGDNTDAVNSNVKEIMAGSMMDYRIVACVETKILDVIQHEKS